LAPLCVAKVLFSCLLLAESINIGQVGITLSLIFSLP
jgi:predicted transporter